MRVLLFISILMVTTPRAVVNDNFINSQDLLEQANAVTYAERERDPRYNQPAAPKERAYVDNLKAQLRQAGVSAEYFEGNVIFEDETEYRQFVSVPLGVIQDPAIEPIDALVYAYLVFMARKNKFCWPKLDTVAKELRISPRSLDTIISRLKQALYLLSFRRGQGMSNLYVFRSARQAQALRAKNIKKAVKEIAKRM